MAKTRVLNHLADIKIEVTAESIEEMYDESLRALSGLLAELPPESEEPEGTALVKWEKSAAEEELVEFLSEALSLSHLKGAVCLLDWIRLGDSFNEASLSFFGADGFHTDVKAVTYHEASVEKLEEGGWRSVFILDI